MKWSRDKPHQSSPSIRFADFRRIIGLILRVTQLLRS